MRSSTRSWRQSGSESSCRSSSSRPASSSTWQASSTAARRSRACRSSSSLLAVRGLPALFYRPLAERGSQLVAGGLLQATSLSIPVVAGQIGVDLGLIRPTNYVALVAAGLLSVIVFPLVSLTLLRGREQASAIPEPGLTA